MDENQLLGMGEEVKRMKKEFGALKAKVREDSEFLVEVRKLLLAFTCGVNELLKQGKTAPVQEDLRPPEPRRAVRVPRGRLELQLSPSASLFRGPRSSPGNET
jgi:hypothetical protein